MRVCPRCGTENPPEANFCLWCGAALRARVGGVERKVITVLFCDLELASARGHLAPLPAAPLVDEVDRLAGRIGYAADSIAAS